MFNIFDDTPKLFGRGTVGIFRVFICAWHRAKYAKMISFTELQTVNEDFDGERKGVNHRKNRRWKPFFDEIVHRIDDVAFLRFFGVFVFVLRKRRVVRVLLCGFHDVVGGSHNVDCRASRAER